MAKIAAESGTTDIVATPHANIEFTFNPELIDRKIAELQAQAAETEDFQEGARAFLEKRNPRFIGR